MKLTAHTFERLAQADSRFSRFDDRFNAFLQRLTFFNESHCPVKGITIELVPTERRFTAKYRTVVVGFRMFFQLNAQGTTSARVVCTLEEPYAEAIKASLGIFTFNAQGFTDLEVDQEGDPIELEEMAPEIVVHFIQLALAHGAA